jgi:hypothetical protein
MIESIRGESANIIIIELIMVVGVIFISILLRPTSVNQYQIYR